MDSDPIAGGELDHIDDLPRQPRPMAKLVVGAMIVGLLVGVVGAAFHLSLQAAGVGRDWLIQFGRERLGDGVGWVGPVLLCALGAGIAAWLPRRFAPMTSGSGIPSVELVLRRRTRPAVSRILPIKFIGGVLGIASGLALGREGPTVQMGATIGRLTNDWLRRWFTEPWTLVAAGAGAGLATAFNAPTAAAIFVMEELVYRFSARMLAATLVACVSATVVLRACVDKLPAFSVSDATYQLLPSLPWFVLLGCAAGLLGAGFNRLLVWTMDRFEAATALPWSVKGAIVGAGAGLMAWFAPGIVGGGEELAQLSLDIRATLGALAGLMLLRLGLTVCSYATGAPGGIFAPVLAIGALLGSGFALCTSGASPSALIVVAMAACFTAVVRSPLTGIVLLLEMTGSFSLMLPMLAACAAAYLVPELLGVEPIYETLRARDERRDATSSAA